LKREGSIGTARGAEIGLENENKSGEEKKEVLGVAVFSEKNHTEVNNMGVK